MIQGGSPETTVLYAKHDESILAFIRGLAIGDNPKISQVPAEPA